MTIFCVTSQLLYNRAAHVACFFFQAEDGIRDLTVTGVQTCALPISSNATQRSFSSPLLQREMQAGIHERGGLPRTWRTDDHVPRQVVEAVPALPLLLEQIGRASGRERG